jgi:hypothetical protein
MKLRCPCRKLHDPQYGEAIETLILRHDVRGLVVAASRSLELVTRASRGMRNHRACPARSFVTLGAGSMSQTWN